MATQDVLISDVFDQQRLVEFLFDKLQIIVEENLLLRSLNVDALRDSVKTGELIYALKAQLLPDALYKDAPELVKSARLLQMFTDESQRRVILVITEDVTAVTEQLRTYFHPRKLVGNKEHLWMLSSLDFFVMTPDLNKIRSGISHTDVHGFVVDQRSTSTEFVEQLRCTINSFQGLARFPVPLRLKDDGTIRFRKYSCELKEFRPLISEDLLGSIERFLPEAASCMGLLDASFCSAASIFCALDIAIVSQDYSIFVAFMPALVRAAANFRTTRSLVITSGHRAPLLEELLRRFVVHLGLCEVQVSSLSEQQQQQQQQVQIAVGTPEQVLKLLQDSSASTEVNRVVLYDTDVLCTSGLKQQILSILNLLKSDARVGLHTSNLLPDVEDIVDKLQGKVDRLEKAEMTIRGVRHLYEVADNKISKLVDIWKQWVAHVSIFCSSVESIELVASELRDAGIRVVTTHTGMDKEALEDAATEFSTQRCFLVTNIVYGMPSIIQFDVPQTAQEYVRRVETSRGGSSFRIVINLFSKNEVPLKDELEQRLGIYMLPLPSNCRKLPAQILAREHGRQYEV